MTVWIHKIPLHGRGCHITRSQPIHNNKKPACYNEKLTHNNEKPTRNNEKPTHYNELSFRYNELVSRYYELFLVITWTCLSLVLKMS